jgi:threonine dehydratase
MNMTNHDLIKSILSSHVYDVAIETPLDAAKQLSDRFRNNIFLKREDLQPIYSFKLRGAYNKIAQLSPEARAKGIIAASAGNHAQGVAFSARKLGIKATIVMPKTTPSIKTKSVQRLGGKVILHGDAYNDAYDHASQLVAKHGYTFVHPYDDWDVIAGQGTVGLEISQQLRDIDAIFIPVGGGGLMAGVAAYFKYIYPNTRIIGVEPSDAACLKAALEAQSRVILSEVGLFVDGVAVKQIGERPFEIAKTCIDEVVTVSTDEVCAAVQDIFEDTRAIAEPAGALALAGLKRYIQTNKWEGKNCVAILSGANLNFHRLRHISERSEIGENREALLAVTIPEAAGSFKKFCKLMGRRAITEFNYRYANPDKAVIFVGLELEGLENEREQICNQLIQNGYPVVDLSNNEVAMLHIRHMVGGPSDLATEEQLFRFEFPERPGALMQFLNKLGTKWNISLFHYRNHGADFGRVLAGVQVPTAQRAQFQSLLTSLNYHIVDESNNPAYRLFL